MEVASTVPVLQSNRSMTKYCDIFDCYWGNSKYLNDNEIIKNRNEFVEDLNIKKSKKKNSDYIKYQFNPSHLFEANPFYSSKKHELIKKFKEDNNIKNINFIDHLETYENDNFYIGLFSAYNISDEDIQISNNLDYKLYHKVLYNGATTFIKKIPKSIGYRNTNSVFRNI